MALPECIRGRRTKIFLALALTISGTVSVEGQDLAVEDPHDVEQKASLRAQLEGIVAMLRSFWGHDFEYNYKKYMLGSSPIVVLIPREEMIRLANARLDGRARDGHTTQGLAMDRKRIFVVYDDLSPLFVANVINHEIVRLQLSYEKLSPNDEEARLRKIVDTAFFERIFGREWLEATVSAIERKILPVEKYGGLYNGYTPQAVQEMYDRLNTAGLKVERTILHDRILENLVFVFTNREDSLSTVLAADTAQEGAHRPSATPSGAGTVYGPPASDDPQIAGSQAVQKGDYIAARKYFRLALERAEMDPEPGSELVASLRNLGEVLHRTGEYVEAEKLFDRAIEILRISRTADKRLLPVLLTSQGRLYEETGRYVLSESLLKEALRLTELHFGSQHMHMVRALNSLGILYMSTNKRGQAETHFKKAIGLAEKLSAGDDATIAPLLGNLAVLYENQERWNRAALLLVRALDMAESGYDSDHLETATILHNLGVARYRQGKLDEAEKMLRRALGIRQKVLGPTNIFVATASFTLAVILTDKGNYDEAKLRYTEALQVQEERLGLKAPEVATTLEHLAFVLRKMKSPQEASGLATRAKLIRAETDYSVKIEVGTGRR